MKILVLNHAPFQSPDAKFYTIQIHSVHGEPNGSLVQNIAFGFFLMLQHTGHTDLHSSNIPRNRNTHQNKEMRHYLCNVHVSIENCDKFYDFYQSSRVDGKRLLTHPKIQP